MSSKNTRSGRSVKPPKRMISEDDPQDESSKDTSVVKALSSTQRQAKGQAKKDVVKPEQITKVQEKSEKNSSVKPTQIIRSKRAAAQAAKSSLKEKPINTKLRRGDPISKSDIPERDDKPQSPLQRQKLKRQDSGNKTNSVSVDSKSDAAPTKRAAAQAAKSSLKEKPVNTKLRRGNSISKSDIPASDIKPQSPLKRQRQKRQVSGNKTEGVSVDSKNDAAPTKRATKRVALKKNLEKNKEVVSIAKSSDSSNKTNDVSVDSKSKTKEVVSITESPHKKARMNSRVLSKEEISKMLLENDDTSDDELDIKPNNAPDGKDSDIEDKEVSFNMSRTRSSTVKNVKDLEAEADKKRPIYMRSNPIDLTNKVEIFNEDPYEIEASDDDEDVDKKKKRKMKRKRKATQKKKADMLLVFGSNATFNKEALKAKKNLTIREKKVIKPKELKRQTETDNKLEEKAKLIHQKPYAAEKSLIKNSENVLNDVPIQTEMQAPSVIVSSPPQYDYTSQNIPSVPNVEVDEPPVFDDCNEIDVENNDRESMQNLNKPPPQNPTKDLKKYMTPVIPKHTKKMIQERKASTPRVTEELPAIKPPTKEEQIKKCFGFDDSIPSTGSDDSQNDNESLIGFSPVRGFQASNQIMISPTNSISSVNSFTRIRDSTNFVSVKSVQEAPAEGKTFKSGGPSSKVIGGRFEFIRPKLGSSKLVSATTANSFKSSSSQIGGHRDKANSCSKSVTKPSTTKTSSESSVKDVVLSNNLTLYQDPEADEVPLEAENNETDTANADDDQPVLIQKQGARKRGGAARKKVPQPLNTVTNTIMKTSTTKATKQPLIYETDGGSKRLRANISRVKQPSLRYNIIIIIIIPTKL